MLAPVRKSLWSSSEYHLLSRRIQPSYCFKRSYARRMRSFNSETKQLPTRTSASRTNLSTSPRTSNASQGKTRRSAGSAAS